MAQSLLRPRTNLFFDFDLFFFFFFLNKNFLKSATVVDLEGFVIRVFFFFFTFLF